MKKLLLFAFAVFAFAACTQNDVEELSANRADVPETLTIGFEGDDTRIQLNEAQKTVWTKGDLVSVFYHSDANQKWQFQGETGERQGQFKRLQNAESTTKIANIVVTYPYSEDYFLNTQSYNIEATLPSVQHYAEDSYGVGDNLMVSQSEFTQFTLKSVCGWLKIQLTGNGEKVTRLMLRGNNEEQLAGLIYVDTDTAESTLVSEMGGYDDMENSVGGGLIPDDAIVTEITLNCGEGVVLGSAAKSFYIAVPPQTFEKGFTVEVECDNGTSTTKSTSESITIERNHIKPMETIEYDGVLPEVYELAYRTNDGKALDPITTEGFGGEFEENIFDAATGEGKLVFAGAVTTIPNQAFGFCENLTWIEIPLGITSIGVGAFSGCSSMVELTIPASVASVGEGAFSNCTGKAYINCNMPGADYLSNPPVSFSRANFTEVVIGDSVTTIGDNAFYWCDSLTSVTIPESVTTIGNYAFSDCTSLTSITIPDSVTTIGEWAFSNCTSLTSITIPDSITTIGEWAFSDCSSLTSITIPDSVTTIGERAFYRCESLTSITIPDSVTTIGDFAFYYCSSLTSVTIPDSVTTIGEAAFASCDSLTEFNGKFASEDGRCLIVEGLLNSFAIGCGATEYTIPDSVTTIGNAAFSNCHSLTSVTIPDSVTTIGDSAFSNCSSLTSITIPDSVTTIGDNAFSACYNLTSVTIPDSVTTIGDYAFSWCYSLTSVYCEATTPPSLGGSYVFDDNALGRTIYVPEESVRQYKIAAGWSEYADAIVGYDFENPENNPIFTTSNLVVSYSDFTLDVKPLKGEKSFWTYYIWTKENYEEVLNNEAQANIVQRSYWALNNLGLDAGFDFGTFIKEYMGQTGTLQISAYEPLENDTEYVLVLFYMDPEASDPTDVYDYNYAAVEFKTLAPSAEDYATLEVGSPIIESADNKYNIHFNVKTDEKAVDIKVGAQLWANYDFAKYWDETNWSQIQIFFLFRTSVSTESLTAAKTADGATIAFNDVDKDDYVFFFEALTEHNTPTQYAIRVTPEMFE